MAEADQDLATPLRLSARLAAAALVLLGVCTLSATTDTPLGIEGVTFAPSLGFAVVGVVLAAGFLVVPWDRLARWWFLAALAALFTYTVAHGWATGYYESAFGPAVLAAEYLILSTLVGLTQRRGVPTGFAFFMLGVFLVSSVVVTPVAVLVIGVVFGTPLAIAQGEVVAWSVTAFVDGRRVDRRRVADVSSLSSSIAALRHGLAPADAATTIARLAETLLHGTDARVLVRLDGSCEQDLVDQLGWSRDEVAGVAAGLRGRRVEEVRRADGRWLALPLVSDEAVVGLLVLAVEDAPDEFTRELGAMLASEAAGVLAQTIRIEALAAESNADALTGVGNRRHADRILAELAPGDAVLVIDVDRFKEVNDHHGHTAGDEILREIARFLQDELREDSRIARYGGDEFVVVLTGAGDGASGIAERLVSSWRRRRPLTTFSVGVAVHDGADPAATFATADRSLYEAKSSR